MELREAIFSRRSIRKYKNEKIPEKKLEELCICGLAAPSANNTKPVECVIIQKEETLAEIGGYKPQWYMLKNAAAAILVIGRREKYFQQNCAAAVENILLAAVDGKIGSVWLGLYPNGELEEKIRKKLKIPENKLPFCFIALGYDAEEKKKEFTYHPNKIHWECYQE